MRPFSARCATRRLPGALLALLLVLAAAPATAANLTVGEMRILTPGEVDRVAVGNANVISTSLLKNGQLLVFGEAPGVTTLHVWLKSGEERQIEFTVDKADYAAAVTSGVLQQKLAAVRRMIASIPGLEVNAVGDKLVMTGQYDGRFAQQIKAVTAAYPEVLDLTLSTKLNDVRQLTEGIDGIQARLVGERIVLSGTIDEGYKDTIATIVGAYPEIMDITRKEIVRLPDQKMVLVNIRITEFNKSASDSLGINWSNNFAGPAAAISSETGFGGSRTDGVTILGGSNTPGSLASIDPALTQKSFGYFGIATEITSRINLAINSGDAMILAEPRLVARSGGEAKFLAGGEIPIEVVTPTSATIEFKQFGILLNIKPEVDRDDNIRAHVETEISAVDNSVSVGNTPGFLTRRTDADILLRSGETLVMSGLVDREMGRDLTGLKGFASLPVLGPLFRSRDFRDKKTDLVIFVTLQVYDAEHKQNIASLSEEKEREKKFLDSIKTSTFKLVE